MAFWPASSGLTRQVHELETIAPRAPVPAADSPARPRSPQPEDLVLPCPAENHRVERPVKARRAEGPFTARGPENRSAHLARNAPMDEACRSFPIAPGRNTVLACEIAGGHSATRCRNRNASAARLHRPLQQGSP